MQNIIILPELKELIEAKEFDVIKEIFYDSHSAEIAEQISALEPEEAWQIIELFDKHRRAEIFSFLDLQMQVDIAEIIERNKLVDLLTEMSSDDRVDLFKRFPEEKQELILPLLAQAEREDIRRLAEYPEGSAGSVMTSEYVAIPDNITVDEAIRRIRLEASQKETIFYIYVINEKRQLIGFVSLTDLIMAHPSTRIKDIMKKDVIYVTIDEDQEKVARKIQKYDLIAIPVVNGNNVLVGIVTHDDAIDIITQEQTEDLEKFMAIAGAHAAAAYSKTPVLTHFKNRAVWVVSLATIGLVSGMIIHSFENTLMNLMILALYMPMIADTGGNVGSQSATVVLRALALGEVTFHDFFKVIWKEFRISLLLALALGFLSWIKVVLLSSNSEMPLNFSLQQVGFVIAIALSLQVVTATLIGASLPLIATKFKLDPAVVASPALTTIVDITGLLIYFTTAKLLLGI
ncbi:MAG TPA: magnesium transporter [Candidatus Kapabacteria bacterium]|nr:magnesium transporter [Candidatus Kapabacteria bacterium]